MAAKFHKLALALSGAALALMLAGCSIDETDNQEQLAEAPEEELRELNLAGFTKLQRDFMQSCEQCIMGDVSELTFITTSYLSSMNDADFAEPLALQQYRPNALFESCAQKAAQLHHFEPLKAIVARAGLAARISQRFYAEGRLTDGAFWLQRVLNLSGEQNGYATAGRVFVRHRSTIETGAKLLEQAARMGDTESAQILIGLTDPTSSYYQNLRD